MDLLTNHVRELLANDLILLGIGIAYSVFRETQRGVVLKKLVEDIKESADSPAVKILKSALNAD